MKKFLLKIILFITPLIIFAIIIVYKADGYTDAFYNRFTTPKHQSMILGTSRAAQGIQPKYLNKKLNVKINNYSFTLLHSPFGKIYLESIKRKHSKEKNGVFIISIDPWSISSWSVNPNDINEFRENNLCLDNTKIVDLNPNIIYLAKNFSGNYKKLIDFSKENKNTYLHKDGWLEIMNIPMDSLSVITRTKNKINIYKTKHLLKSNFSFVRLNYLIKTIDYLKDYGEVYLVRLPINPKLMEIENQYMPDFNVKIKKAISISNGYLDLTIKNRHFKYTDGNHLYKDSGKIVTIEIANWIKNQKNN